MMTRGFLSYLLTLFFGAFNDNASKMIVILTVTMAMGAGSKAANLFVPLVGACFIIPYLLFSTLAGYLADRFSKKKVMVWSKFAEILIMLGGLLLMKQNARYLLLPIMFFMGAQSAFFSPAKYGFLPETLKPEWLSKGNGMTQLFTFVSIIFGGWFGGMLITNFKGAEWHSMWFCIGIAIIGFATSLFITPTVSSAPNLPFTIKDPITPHIRTFREIRQDGLLMRSIFANTFFWFLGTIYQLALVSFGQLTLKGDGQIIGALQGIVALGIGIGCAVAGAISKKKTAYWMILPGGLALGLFAIFLGVFGTTNLSAFALIGLLGISGGFFQLPANTAIQQRAPEAKRGRLVSASNALDSISMTAAAFVLWLLQSVLKLSPSQLFIAIGILTLAVILLFFRQFSTK